MTHTQQPQNSQPSLMGLQALAQAQTNPQPTPPAAPASNAFRPATAANNNQQANGAAAPAPAAAPAQPQNNNANRLNRPGLFGNQEKVNAPFLPLARSVVRFELDGLGDPFYRLLGHPLNPDLTSGKAIAQMLETGGENVSALEKLLETAWTGYALKGAALVYRWNQPTWKGLVIPYFVPPDENAQQNSTTGQDDDELDAPSRPMPKPLFSLFRAIDLQLVINVLARARSQVLLANAPLLFNQSYLTRSLVTDDARMVALARATGAIQEGLMA